MIVSTLSQLFELVTTKYNKPNLLIYRGRDGAFHPISTNEFRDRVVYFALGLRELGVTEGQRLLLLSENRPEWHITDFACHLLGVVMVPVFPTLIAEQVEYIINDSGAEVVVVSGGVQLQKIRQIRDRIEKVKHTIVVEADEKADDAVSFHSVVAGGREQDETGFVARATSLAKPDMLATIIYTSGTTGVPKGVMLSHKNFVSNMLGCSSLLEMNPDDLGLSFLPISHSFERTVDYVYFYRGVSIVYSANIEALAADIEEARPTLMANVPRFYDKVKAGIEAAVERDGGIKKKFFYWALATGRKAAAHRLELSRPDFLLRIKHAVANRLVFGKIRQRMGGRIRYFISGGAPLSAEVGLFFESVGLRILEGYGLTETSPVIAINPGELPRFGTVGKILQDVEVKIAEDGEVLVKGPNIMIGYYNMPAETEEVMSDGWFHTGDIGRLDAAGYLCITDRKKQIIVTSVGKNIAPQAIEQTVERSKYVEQVLLVGDQRRFISALIVPDFAQLKMFAQQNGLSDVSPANLIREQAVLDLIQSELDGQQTGLSHYEQIRRFSLLAEPFTIENGQLTPTMKVKRKVVLEKYADLIEAMYAS